MNRHNLNGIIDDYEKKLLLYSSINNSKELTSLNKKGLVEKTADTPRKYFLTEQGVNFNLQ